jgi:hypothetical protein
MTTDKDLLNMVARTDGFHHKPAYYKMEVKRRFNKTVSSASVTKALGTYRNRLNLPEKALLSNSE